MMEKIVPKIQEAIPLLNREYLQNFSVTLKTKPEACQSEVSVYIPKKSKPEIKIERSLKIKRKYT